PGRLGRYCGTRESRAPTVARRLSQAMFATLRGSGMDPGAGAGTVQGPGKSKCTTSLSMNRSPGSVVVTGSGSGTLARSPTTLPEFPAAAKTGRVVVIVECVRGR